MSQYYAYGVGANDSLAAASKHCDITKELATIHQHPFEGECGDTCFTMEPNLAWGRSVADVEAERAALAGAPGVPPVVPVRQRYRLVYTAAGRWAYRCRKCGSGAVYGDSLIEVQNHAIGHVTLRNGCWPYDPSLDPHREDT